MIKSPLKIAQEILQLDSTEYYGDDSPVLIILSEAVVKLTGENEKIPAAHQKCRELQKDKEDIERDLAIAKEALRQAERLFNDCMRYAQFFSKAKRLEISTMKFKVGQRIAVYDMGKRYVCTIKIINDSQTVTANYENNKPFTCLVHVKQCRLLKKKERRRIWVDMPSLYRSGDRHIVYYEEQGGCVEFVEVKK